MPRVHRDPPGDPQFDADVAAAEAQFIQGQLEVIKDAAKKGSWQASAWMLERRLPAEFSQPRVQLSVPMNVEYKELSVLVDELRQSPEAMRLLPKELFDTLISEANSEPSTAEGEESAPPHESEPKSNSEQETN